nr:4'-phosphopantetheinyl transferase superfamily protein [uncultured Porphyromonas sp.]
MILEHIEGLPLGVALCLCHFPPVSRSERRSVEQRAVELILSELLGESAPRRGYDPLGRPILLDHPDRSLSISHTEGHAAVLLTPSADGTPGVDIETYRPQLYEVASRYIHPDEWERVQATSLLDELQLRSLLWSAKETAYKVFNPPGASLLSFTATELRPDGLILTYPQGGTQLRIGYQLRPDYLFTYGVHP